MNVLVDRVEDGHRVDGRRELEDVREVLEPRVVFAVLVVRVVVRGAVRGVGQGVGQGVGHGRRREDALDVRRGERLFPGGVVFVVPALLETIRTEKVISDSTDAKLKELCEGYTNGFIAAKA